MSTFDQSRLPDGEPLNLTSCDREPIHIPGGVQPFGALIAMSADWIVSAASKNVGDVLGLAHDELIGERLKDLIESDAQEAISRRLRGLGFPDAVERIFRLCVRRETNALHDVAVHVSGDRFILEFERAAEDDGKEDATFVRPLIDRINRAETSESMCEMAAKQVRALTGFDRVMVYRFADDGSGEVVAEARGRALEPYLNLRYPASDIPVQARALYARNLLRIISDVDAEPVPIEPVLDPAGAPLDLSMSTLRATSPIHHEYLRNMGVRASMSISILRRGKLWGLFACHHYQPRVLPYSVRTLCELFGQFFSYALEQREADEDRALAEKSTQSHQNLAVMLAEGGDLASNFEGFAEMLHEVVSFDGAALSLDGELQISGRTPTREEVKEVIRFLNRAASSRIFVTDHLAAVHEPAADFAERAAGLMALPISRTPRDYLILFRQEIARSVTWAGNPDKPVEVGPNGARLTPRKSFDAWRQTVRGRSAPWNRNEVTTAENLRITMLEVILRLADEAARERAAAQERQELLIAELNHRVRNILNLIRGLVGQSRAEEQSIDDFVGVVGGRIQALARAHDQITDEQWRPGSLRELIDTEAKAYANGQRDRVRIEGDDVLIEPTAFTVLSLVIHELLTNAMKYGALTDQSGKVTVSITAEEDGGATLAWREKGGPAVQAPTRRGFGSTIIERSVPYELRGKAELHFDVAGVHGRFYVPASFVAGIAEAGEDLPEEETAPRTQLSGTVLVVEDNMIIALDAEMMMEELGAQEVRVASNVADALRILGEIEVSYALLDVNLGTETSEPVAEALRAAGTPFVFATGYGEAISMTRDFGAPTVRKPYETDVLRQAFARTD